MKNGLLAASRVFSAISTAALWLAGVGLVAMTSLVAYQVFMRYVINSSPSWTEAASIQIMSWFIFLGAAVGVREKFHMGFDVLLYALPEVPHVWPVPALVVNILPLDVTLHPGEPLGEALARLGGRLRQLRRHGRYRIEQIAEDYGMEPRSRFFFSPLINVLPFDEARFAGCETTRHVLSNGPGDGFNITIRGDGEACGLELLVEADPTLTPPEDFAALARGLPLFLAAAMAPENLSRPLSDLPG